MKLYTIIIVLVSLSQAINIFNKNTPGVKAKGDTEEGDLPTIIYAGMGQQCNSTLYQNLQDKFRQGLHDAHVECFETKMLTGIMAQAEAACKHIQNNHDFNIKTQINVVGVSQGGLIARYITETCQIGAVSNITQDEDHKVRNLLTIGTPNMGFTEVNLNTCNEQDHGQGMLLCAFQKTIEKGQAYQKEIQDSVSCAGFYVDVNKIGEYHEKSSFLTGLNNDVGITSHLFEQHRNHMEGLHGAMFVMFKDDELIHPKTSAIFGQVGPKDKDGKQQFFELKDTDFYKRNNLGLKYLDIRKKLHLIELDGRHASFTEADIENTFIPFLKD